MNVEAGAFGHEFFSSHEFIRSQMSRLTAEIAAGAKRQILTIHQTGKPESKEERIALIDTAAAATMERILSLFPFGVVSVGSEGKKEAASHKNGVAMPTVLGRFGNGHGEVWMVNDPVEGTTSAANNEPGAISVVGVSSKSGIMPTPDGIHYMEKLFMPPRVAGKVAIDRPVADNLQAVCDAYGVSPSDIKVVVLKRSQNQSHIDAAAAFGATVKRIERGDLIPSLLAVLPPEKHSKGIHVVLGRGGWEEGVIAAVAARAVGGVAEGRFWTEEVGHGKIFPRLTLDDLVPGKQQHSMVIFSAITEDPWFYTQGAIVSDHDASVQTMVIDHHGPSTWGQYLAHQ